MGNRLLLTALLIGVFALGAASNRANTSPRIQQPTIVGTFSLRDITKSVSTTLFTPSVTGVYRASVYLAMSTPLSGGGGSWQLSLNWADDGGNESNFLALVNDNSAPPFDWATTPVSTAERIAPVPFVFEAIAGQPVTFNLSSPADDSGTCGLAIVIERLQ